MVDESPDWISLVKNPHQFVGSLLNPSILDRLVYRFIGPNAHNLAAVHIPTSAFEMTAVYNVLDDPAAVHGGLETLPADQTFHPYVNIRMPQMTNSTCKWAILLPVEWHVRLARDYPFGMALKTFFDVFLAPLSLAEAQNPYSNVYTWWRHATMCTASASTWAHSGLQVSTTQLLSAPKLCGSHDGWAQEQAKRIFTPLHCGPLVVQCRIPNWHGPALIRLGHPAHHLGGQRTGSTH